ncbi:zf-HC2 domain-containing protein [Mycobacterium sp. Y57]|uniref:anti-sigma factor family protein n=1 Tax=Mycolicibacterium xanthum TaxID=2796469 RepID=UPI001C860848|nr:zf-HC2 domain-containing protein [Mycolicibacterium xanthum]MBX7432124.1 zf-HC2 domain-containing protein [Mycolicibacterium xanthum]
MTVHDVSRDRYSTWDAAYVFGSLSTTERREFETHLPACPACRAAVAELSGMPGLLAKVDLADVCALDGEPDGPPPPLRDTVVSRVRSGRRRTRVVAAALAAAAAVLLAGGVAVLARPEIVGLQRGEQQPAAQGASMAPMTEVTPTPIHATVDLTGYGWGTRIDMACSYGEWGARNDVSEPLGMVVVGHDGSRDQVATWLGISGATALPSATTPLQPEEIAAVQLVSVDSGAVLLEKRL